MKHGSSVRFALAFAAATVGPVVADAVAAPDFLGYNAPASHEIWAPVDGQARNCSAGLTPFGGLGATYAAASGTLFMSNDGWCGLVVPTVNGAYVPEVSLTTPPAHGTVQMEKRPDGVGVAYRPAAGFAGVDRFEVRAQYPWNRFPTPVEVTVER